MTDPPTRLSARHGQRNRSTTDRPSDASNGMKVLHVVADPTKGFFRNQVEALVERGVTSQVLPVPGEEKTTRTIGDLLKLVPELRRQSRRDFDVIHVHYGLYTPMALLQRRLPVVVSLWGSDLYAAYGPLVSFAARQADAVVVMSEQMAADYGAECSIIPHAVDTELFKPRPQSAARRTLGWSDNDLHVLFPYSKTREVKNYPFAERIVNLVEETMDHPITLHAVDQVPHQEMPIYMNAADLLLMTSKREGSPNAVKEALACNLPVVTTNVGDVGRFARRESVSICTTTSELVEAVVRYLTADIEADGRAAIEEDGLTLPESAARILAIYRAVT